MISLINIRHMSPSQSELDSSLMIYTNICKPFVKNQIFEKLEDVVEDCLYFSLSSILLAKIKDYKL